MDSNFTKFKILEVHKPFGKKKKKRRKTEAVTLLVCSDNASIPLLVRLVSDYHAAHRIAKYKIQLSVICHCEQSGGDID